MEELGFEDVALLALLTATPLLAAPAGLLVVVPDRNLFFKEPYDKLFAVAFVVRLVVEGVAFH